MASQQNNKSPGEDGLFTILIIVIALFVINYFLQNEWKYGRLIIYKYYIYAYNFLFDLIGYKPELISKAYDLLTIYEPKEISVDTMKKMATDLYPYFSFPFIVILAICYIKYLRNSISFQRTFTRQSLIDDQKKKWAWLHPISELELEPEIEKGEWAMAKRPLDFVKKYQLLDQNNNVIEEKAAVIFSDRKII